MGEKGGVERESQMPGLEEPPKRPEYTSEKSWLGSAKFLGEKKNQYCFIELFNDFLVVVALVWCGGFVLFCFGLGWIGFLGG